MEGNVRRVTYRETIMLAEDLRPGDKVKLQDDWYTIAGDPVAVFGVGAAVDVLVLGGKGALRGELTPHEGWVMWAVRDVFDVLWVVQMRPAMPFVVLMPE